MRGIKELSEEETLAQERNRKDGGGRQEVLKKHPAMDQIFLRLLAEHTAGDPMDEKVKWTDLSCAEMGTQLAQKGFKVSRTIQYLRHSERGEGIAAYERIDRKNHYPIRAKSSGLYYQ